MGNYYAGMMNNTGGYGELKHHGILGQKWGVRRWQNADGSLTAAGRERYYGKAEKAVATIKSATLSVSKLVKLPQVKDAATQVKTQAQKYYKLQNDEQLAVEKAIDDFYKDLKPSERNKYVGMPLNYDEDVFGEPGEAEFLKYSSHPSAKKFRELHNAAADAGDDLEKSIKNAAKNIVSDGASKQSLRKIEQAVNYAAEDMYMKSSTDKRLWIKFKTPDSLRNYIPPDDLKVPRYDEESSKSIPKTGMPNSSSVSLEKHNKQIDELSKAYDRTTMNQTYYRPAQNIKYFLSKDGIDLSKIDDVIVKETRKLDSNPITKEYRDYDAKYDKSPAIKALFMDPKRNTLERKYREESKKATMNAVNEIMKEIHKLPKQYQDEAKSYAYLVLGYDW